jgi:hypothetical protein
MMDDEKRRTLRDTPFWRKYDRILRDAGISDDEREEILYAEALARVRAGRETVRP